MKKKKLLIIYILCFHLYNFSGIFNILQPIGKKILQPIGKKILLSIGNKILPPIEKRINLPKTTSFIKKLVLFASVLNQIPDIRKTLNKKLPTRDHWVIAKFAERVPFAGLLKELDSACGPIFLQSFFNFWITLTFLSKIDNFQNRNKIFDFINTKYNFLIQPKGLFTKIVRGFQDNEIKMLEKINNLLELEGFASQDIFKKTRIFYNEIYQNSAFTKFHYYFSPKPVVNNNLFEDFLKKNAKEFSVYFKKEFNEFEKFIKLKRPELNKIPQYFKIKSISFYILCIIVPFLLEKIIKIGLGIPSASFYFAIPNFYVLYYIKSTMSEAYYNIIFILSLLAFQLKKIRECQQNEKDITEQDMQNEINQIKKIPQEYYDIKFYKDTTYVKYDQKATSATMFMLYAILNALKQKIEQNKKEVNKEEKYEISITDCLPEFKILSYLLYNHHLVCVKDACQNKTDSDLSRMPCRMQGCYEFGNDIAGIICYTDILQRCFNTIKKGPNKKIIDNPSGFLCWEFINREDRMSTESKHLTFVLKDEFKKKINEVNFFSIIIETMQPGNLTEEQAEEMKKVLKNNEEDDEILNNNEEDYEIVTSISWKGIILNALGMVKWVL